MPLKSIVTAFLLITSTIAVASESSTNIRWIESADNCEKSVVRYLEWHAMALSVGGSVEPDEFEWLRNAGLVTNDKPSNFYEKYVLPEQEISRFNTVVARCTEHNYGSRSSGEVVVGAKLRDGKERHVIFSHENGNRFELRLPDSQINENHESAETFAEKFLVQIPYLRAEYEQLLSQLIDRDPSNLLFNENRVDLWFQWPVNMRMIWNEKQKGTGNENGIELEYQGDILRSENEVRVSWLADTITRSNTQLSEADFAARNAEMADYCIANKLAQCWYTWGRSLPSHLSLNEKGQMTQGIVDAGYVVQIKKLLSKQLNSATQKQVIFEKIDNALSNDEVEEITFPGAGRRPLRLLPNIFENLHDISLEKGKPIELNAFPSELLDFRSVGAWYIPAELISELVYLGKKTCSTNTSVSECAVLEYSIKHKKPEALVAGDKRLGLTMNVLIDPHTLLPFEVNYKTFLETVLNSETEAPSNVDSSDRQQVDSLIRMRYELTQ